jgi:hypothetical protein
MSKEDDSLRVKDGHWRCLVYLAPESIKHRFHSLLGDMAPWSNADADTFTVIAVCLTAKQRSSPIFLC